MEVMLSFLAAAAIQTANLGPMMPMGISTEVQAKVLAVEELSKSDIARAKALAERLPRRGVRVNWSLPSTATTARDAAVRDWKTQINELQIDYVAVADADLVIKPGSTTAFTFGKTAAEPALTATINTAEPRSIQNAIEKALALYFGVVETPFPGLLSSPGSETALGALHPRPFEAAIAKSVLDACQVVRGRISDGRAMEPAWADYTTSVSNLEKSATLQGTPIEWEIGLASSGNSPFQYRLLPDCSRPKASSAWTPRSIRESSRSMSSSSRTAAERPSCSCPCELMLPPDFEFSPSVTRRSRFPVMRRPLRPTSSPQRIDLW